MIWAIRCLLPLLLLVSPLARAVAQTDVTLVPQSHLIDQLGDCLVSTEPRLSSEWLHGTDAERRTIWRSLAKRSVNCMKVTELRFPPWVLAGTIAGATLRATPGMMDAARALPVVPPHRIASDLDDQKLLAALAACVAAAEPKGTAEVVSHPLNSAHPDQMLAFVADALSACVPESMELHIRMPELRAVLASSLYQRLNPASGAP